MSFKAIRFSNSDQSQREFISVLRQRVNHYFESNNLSKYANGAMYLKTVAMFAIYLVPYTLLYTLGDIQWIGLVLWAIMGVGMAGIGLSVMHDANHGTYSKNPLVNKILGFSMYFLGGNSVNWRIQHNVLHHSFTNIDGVDEDISPVGILRFSPHKPLKSMHKYQHIYAWPLYGLMTIMWILTKDFKQVRRYRDANLMATQGRTYKGVLTEILLSKVFYYMLILVLPLLLSPIAWYIHLLGFVTMHLIGGFILTTVFQPAHVMPDMSFPLPDDKGSIENSFAIHELATTSNFAPNNKLLSWYVGGLNYQIEHHLFPNICHIHYRDLSEIVKKTTEEFNLPYYSQPTFTKALQVHASMLKQLGRQEPQLAM